MRPMEVLPSSPAGDPQLGAKRLLPPPSHPAADVSPSSPKRQCVVGTAAAALEAAAPLCSEPSHEPHESHESHEVHESRPPAPNEADFDPPPPLTNGVLLNSKGSHSQSAGDVSENTGAGAEAAAEADDAEAEVGEGGRRRSARASRGRQYLSPQELREERKRKRIEAAEERKRLKAAVAEEKKRIRLEAAAERKRLKAEAAEERKRVKLAEKEEKKRARLAAAEERKRVKEEQKARRVNGAAVAAAAAAEADDDEEEAWKKNAGLTSEDRARIPFGPMTANDRVCAWLWGKHFLPFAEPPTLNDDLLAPAKGPPSVHFERPAPAAIEGAS